jgi:fibronectin type 3 domain-containing protein
MKTMILLGAILLLALGCGIKADPVPWETIVPKRIVDLRAVPREGRVVLEWTAPKENTDKSVLTDLVEFQVLRSEGDLVGEECTGCGSKPTVVNRMKLEGYEDPRGKKMSMVVEDLQPRKVYSFQVVSMNRREHSSAPSNPAQVYWDDPPQPPQGVKGEPSDKRVVLSWESVQGATGYNVYRREEDQDFPVSPLNRQPLSTTEYTDLGVQNEKKYLYSVRAVKRVVKTDVEGIGSSDISVTPTDLTAPSSPGGLVAIPLKEGMELQWQRNREPDLLGYYVYRRKLGEGEFMKLTPVPLGKTVFLDTDVTLGQEYDYAVSAVDKSPRKNESPRSEEVRAKYIY